ncbi:MAG: hypothetical protein IKI60_00255 [Alloprevotella sp.]|nr:hypothetical protein [Alloprevotella sp.]
MTVQEAQKIADNYCSKRSQFRKAIYGGIFDNGYLFSLDFQGSGHHGVPLFIIVRIGGVVEELEAHSTFFYKAWHYSNDYLESLKRT